MEDKKCEPLNLLDEGVLREYIQKTVKNTLSEMLLNEMAFALKDYKDRVRNHAPEIARNWCLVRYTAYNENFIALRKHWMNELKTQMNELAIAKIKSRSQSQSKYKIVLSVWAEYEFDRDEHSINGQIANKFETEGIDTLSKEYISVVDDFKNETKKIADVIATGDRIKVNEYVENIVS